MEVGAVKQAFNNEIIQLKKKLNQAKIQIIHKLTRKSKTFKERKLPEKIQEKLKRKAESAVKEVLIIKKIKPRDLGKFIVTHKGELKDYLNKPQVDHDKACARLLLHKSLQYKYNFIRGRFSNVSIHDLLMSRQERLKLKKEAREKQKNKQKGKDKNTNGDLNLKSKDDVEMSGDSSDSDGNDSDIEDLENDDEEINMDNNSKKKGNQQALSKNDINKKHTKIEVTEENSCESSVEYEENEYSENSDNEKNINSNIKKNEHLNASIDNDLEINSNETDEHESENDSNDNISEEGDENGMVDDSDDEDLKFDQDPDRENNDATDDETVNAGMFVRTPVKTPEKLKSNILSNDGLKTDNNMKLNVNKNNKNKPVEKKRKPKDSNKNKNFNEKLLLRKFKKDSNQTVSVKNSVEDPFFRKSTGENFSSVSDPRQADEIKEIHRQGNRKLRRAAMFGHVPNFKPKQGKYESEKQRFNKSGSKHDKFNKRTNKFTDYNNDRSSKFNDSSTFKRKFDKPLDSKPETLHPSWEAKKRQSGLLPFQGKKIVFDES